MNEESPKPTTEIAQTTPAPKQNPITGIYNFACDSCKNNGKLRGWLYVGVSVLTVWVGYLEKWIDAPPKNWYEVCFVFITSVVAGATVLRAYIDQHISESKNI